MDKYRKYIKYKKKGGLKFTFGNFPPVNTNKENKIDEIIEIIKQKYNDCNFNRESYVSMISENKDENIYKTLNIFTYELYDVMNIPIKLEDLSLEELDNEIIPTINKIYNGTKIIVHTRNMTVIYKNLDLLEDICIYSLNFNSCEPFILVDFEKKFIIFIHIIGGIGFEGREEEKEKTLNAYIKNIKNEIKSYESKNDKLNLQLFIENNGLGKDLYEKCKKKKIINDRIICQIDICNIGFRNYFIRPFSNNIYIYLNSTEILAHPKTNFNLLLDIIPKNLIYYHNYF